MPQSFIDIDLKLNIKDKLKVGNAYNSYDYRVEDILNLECVNTINSLPLKQKLLTEQILKESQSGPLPE